MSSSNRRFYESHIINWQSIGVGRNKVGCAAGGDRQAVVFKEGGLLEGRTGLKGLLPLSRQHGPDTGTTRLDLSPGV